MKKIREDDIYVFCEVENILIKRAKETGFISIGKNIMQIKKEYFYSDLELINKELKKLGLKETNFPYNNTR